MLKYHEISRRPPYLSALIHELPLGLSNEASKSSLCGCSSPYSVSIGDLRYQHRNGSMFVRVWEPSEAGSGTCHGMMFKAGWRLRFTHRSASPGSLQWPCAESWRLIRSCVCNGLHTIHHNIVFRFQVCHGRFPLCPLQELLGPTFLFYSICKHTISHNDVPRQNS